MGWWDIWFWQGDVVQFFIVCQLGDQCLLQQGRFFVGFVEGVVSQYVGELYKFWDFIEMVEYQYQGDVGVVQVGQQGSQLLVGVDVEIVERFIEDQQLWIGYQGLIQQGFMCFFG